MMIQSDQRVGIGLTSNISSALHVNSEASLGPDNNNRMILGSTSGGVGSIGTIESGTASFNTMAFKGGSVGIGTTDPLRQLHIHNTSANSEIAFTAGTSGVSSILFGDGLTGTDIYRGYVQYNHATDTLILATSATSRVTIDDAGRFRVPSAYSSTTSSGANVVVQSDGKFERSTSSLRYKNTINDATHGLTELLTLRPVTFKGNDDGDTIFGGLIAEEVHDSGLTEFVQYDDENRPDALAYGNMVSLCIKAIQEQQTTITAQAAKIETLETQNTTQATQIADLITRVEALEGA